MKLIKKILFSLTLLLVTLSLVTVSFVKGAITNSSRVIPYQGRLTDSSGNNVADGTYSLTFKIYTVSSGGSASFTETNSSVSVSSGLFSVLLGSLSANGVNLDFANPPYYLGITVGANAEMSPRIQLGFAPLAHNAQYLDGTPLSSFELLGSTASRSAALIFSNTPTISTTAKQSLTFGDTNTGNIIFSGGNLGVGTTTPSRNLDVVGTIYSTGMIQSNGDNNPSVSGSSTGAGDGVYGYSVSGVGVRGYTSGTTGGTYGVYGYTSGNLYSIGVAGNNTAGWGVWGNSSSNVGVYGQSSSGFGTYCNAPYCGGTQNWTNNSDERLKEDIVDLSSTSGVDSIMKLRPVTFSWKDSKLKITNGQQLGFIAQDVQKVFPQLVVKGVTTTINHKDGTNEIIEDPLAMNYSGLVVPLVKAVQELKAENEELKARLEKLESIVIK